MNKQKHFSSGAPQVGEVYRNIRTNRVVEVVRLERMGMAEFVHLKNVETGKRSTSRLDAWMKYPVLYSKVSYWPLEASEKKCL